MKSKVNFFWLSISFFFILATLFVYNKSQNMNKPTVLILLGPPGIGKGTQAVKMSEHLNLPHISTGDILRENIKKQTPIGLETKAIIESGNLVPDTIINKMIELRTKEADCAKGYILDGYPRTINQAEELEKRLHGKANMKVLNFSAKQETIVERLSGRLTCSQCGKSYHKKFSPPKQERACDACHGSLIQRKDDQESVIVQRFQAYEKDTLPLISFYQKRELLKTIDCEKPIEEIFQEALKGV